MIDVNSGFYEMKGIDYFINKRPFVNMSMEGQLCYDFPSPKKSFEEFLNEDLEVITKINLDEDLSIKKLKLLKKAEILNDKQIKKIIKDKLRIEKIEEDLEFRKLTGENKIKEIIKKNKEVLLTWDEIEKRIKTRSKKK